MAINIVGTSLYIFLNLLPLPSDGTGLQLGRDEEEQRKHAQIGKQVLSPTHANPLAK